MPTYHISDPNTYRGTAITSEMFGTNFVATYDYEFSPSSNLLPLLASLNIQHLRYPGGSVTEHMFATPDYHSDQWIEDYLSTENDQGRYDEQLDNFFEVAGGIGAEVQLVLPTQIAFTQTAGQALANGTYGSRSELDQNYLTLLENYVEWCIGLADRYGTEISRLEIGNEFWGSGKMSASEYGRVAASVTEYLDESFSDIDIIAQITPSAGLFNPLDDKTVYLEQNGEDYEIHFWPNVNEISENGYELSTMPGEGSGRSQTIAIADAFRDNEVALNTLDGIVDHVYFRRGFSGIDTERDYGLYVIPDTFEERTGISDIDFFITEWSPRNPRNDKESNISNDRGLQYASTIVEAFFELTSSGVDGANFWPLTFGAPKIDRRTLIDTDDGDLTFGGLAFQMLESSTRNMVPDLDYDLPGVIDVHGFSDTDEYTIFVSERSGELSSVTIDFSELGLDTENLISITSLSEDGDTGFDAYANPILSETGGYVSAEQNMDLTLAPWSLTSIVLQRVSSEADELVGTELSDRMEGKGGDDTLISHGGADWIHGNQGNDFITGGTGDDTLKGGWGQDTIFGGEGDDEIFGTIGKNFLHGGVGEDTITSSFDGDFMFGNEGSDIIISQSGSDYIDSGEGNDAIFFVSDQQFGSDVFAVNMSSRSQLGTLEIISLEGFSRYANILEGGDGWDTLTLSEQNDAIFLDDSVSEYDPYTYLDFEGDRSRKFGDIEEVSLGDGNDLFDFTSSVHQLAEKSMIVHGGNGNDVIWASNANDTIFGGSGDDTIFAGAGTNFINGGDGADVFEFTITSTDTTIEDFDPLEGDKLKIFSGKDYEVLMEETSIDNGVISFSFMKHQIESTVSLDIWGFGSVEDNGILQSNQMSWIEYM